MQTLIKKQTQEAKILAKLKKSKGRWVNGRFFLQTMMISQFHARIFSLQKKGFKILASLDRDDYGFKYYKLDESNS